MKAFVTGIFILLSLQLTTMLKCMPAAGKDTSGAVFATDTLMLQQQSLDSLTTRICKVHIDQNINTDSLNDYVRQMQADGSWNDINYADTALTAWKPLQHLERLLMMAVAYRQPQSPFYRDKQLLAKTMAGLQFYVRRKPTSSNWWYRDIGAPQVLMVPLLLLKNVLSADSLIYYSSFLKDATVNPSHKGKNLSWVSEITIYKGCIENNYQLVEKGFTAMASTIFVANRQGAEGIKADNSFHQHHAQLYTGGYGMSIAGDYARYLNLTRHTLFANAFTPSKRQTIDNLMLKGHQMLGYRQSIDFGSVGRNISRVNGTSNIRIGILNQMLALKGKTVAAYQSWKNHLQGAASAVQGNTHFWKSDIMVQHGANYYLSAKIISKRTYGTESLNGENIKGYYLPLGATNIKTTGFEYNKIFPVWDWNRVPGTTALQNADAATLKGYLVGVNQYGGGVSNGAEGIIAFSGEYQSLQARKSYFFMDNVMVCLGSGITTPQYNNVITSVNQCYLKGIPELINHRSVRPLNQEKETILNLKGVFNDGVGYYFPAKQSVTVQRLSQSGTWRSINNAGSDSLITSNVFSVWLNHGMQPVNQSYAYMVLPGKTLAGFKKWMVKPLVTIVKNDSIVQAIKSNYLQKYAVVFYRPGSVNMGNGITIISSQPAVLLIIKKHKGYSISAADPTYQKSSIVLSITKELNGLGATNTGNGTQLKISLPGGELAGKSITNWYSVKN
jgi:hypothetical protein